VEVVHVHADGVDGAGFGAEPAIAAAQDVDIKPLGEFLDMRVGRFAGGDVDAVAGADRLAEHTGGAAHRAVLLDGQAVAASPAVVDRALDFGVLVGSRSDFAFGPDAEHDADVVSHIGHEVAVGDPEALDDLNPVYLLRDSHIDGEGGDFFVHVCDVVLRAFLA